jgi:hypothetical protein
MRDIRNDLQERAKLLEASARRRVNSINISSSSSLSTKVNLKI